MGRALFLFAQGKPLGPGGLDWLKLHTINLTGTKKKEPMRERLRYADEILEDILDSAQNPMTVRFFIFILRFTQRVPRALSLAN